MKKLRFTKHPKKVLPDQSIENIVDQYLSKKTEKTTVVEKKPIETTETRHTLDLVQDQIESPDTSIHCPESIKEKDLKLVKRSPENYIEINMIRKIRIVDNFFIPSSIKTFHYKQKTYKIDEERIYFLPTKTDFIMPTAFYYEYDDLPTDFKQTNIGITGKALSLLYDENLYRDLFSEDEAKYNFVIVILLIIQLIAYAGGLYLHYGYKG